MKKLKIVFRYINIMVLAVMLSFGATPSQALTPSAPELNTHCSDPHKSAQAPMTTDCLAHCTLPSTLPQSACLIALKAERIMAAPVFFLSLNLAPDAPPPRTPA